MQSLRLFLLVAFFAPQWCVAQRPPADELYFPPSTTWETVAAKDAACDQRQLDAALDLAGQHHSKGVVVLWRGKILAERYWDGWDKDQQHAAYSASKSIVSMLVGIAIDQGKIAATDQPAADFLPQWKGDRDHARIKIHDLLSMSAGLEGGKRVFLRGLVARDETAFAISLDVEHAPGASWDYHNSAYGLCFPILEAATGKPLPQYTEERLLRPLGMQRTEWRTKRFNRDQYTFLMTTPRDAARFGLLVLAKGNWNGQQVVGRDWVERATSPANSELNPSYGYLWWLNGGQHHFLPFDPQKKPGPIFPGCPDDSIAALGKGDQKIYVVPSLELVVTRFGDAADSSTPALSEFDAEFLGMICRSFKQSSD